MPRLSSAGAAPPRPLPSYPRSAAADLRDVVGDINRWLAGSAYGMDADGHQASFDEAWFRPVLEFRPRLGEAGIAGVHLELRQAIEPWHVPGRGGDQRRHGALCVDSSVESGSRSPRAGSSGRHVVTPQRRPDPIDPTGSGRLGVGRSASAAARHRRRRCALPRLGTVVGSSPTIGVHSPLVFDLVDRWNGRSLGGFTYHVTHPGGRSYEDYPVNAVAAESRRASRFAPFGHTWAQSTSRPGRRPIPPRFRRNGSSPAPSTCAGSAPAIRHPRDLTEAARDRQGPSGGGRQPRRPLTRVSPTAAQAVADGDAALIGAIAHRLGPAAYVPDRHRESTNSSEPTAPSRAPAGPRRQHRLLGLAACSPLAPRPGRLVGTTA